MALINITVEKVIVKHDDEVIIDLLKKIADNIIKEPSGNIANKILNINKTK